MTRTSYEQLWAFIATHAHDDIADHMNYDGHIFERTP
jgi:hypothetical protein